MEEKFEKLLKENQDLFQNLSNQSPNSEIILIQLFIYFSKTNLKNKEEQDFNSYAAEPNPIVNILKVLPPLFRMKGNENISDEEERDFIMKIRERLPQAVFNKLKLKQFIMRFREAKRPSFLFFKSLIEILDLKEVEYT